MKINLQDSVSSRQDLKAVILEVRGYAKWYSQTAVKMRFSENSSYEQPLFSQAATSLINDWNKENPINQKSLDELVATLEEVESSAPSMTITLAAPPPGSLKKSLTLWCRENIEPNILVDFGFNSTMLGGMIVRFGSHVYDWSFRRQILSSLERFPEILRNV
jgi:hypothetical protein